MNISYRYIDPDMIFTNDREEVISSIQTGEWDCALCPQMFGSEYGCYGLFIPDKPQKRTREEAEERLSGIEQSGRKAFNNEPFNPDSFSDKLPECLYPSQTGIF
jgi:hypothetical protein